MKHPSPEPLARRRIWVYVLRPMGVWFLPMFVLFPLPAAAANNLHLIDSLPNGFAIYRSGRPETCEEVAEYCKLGIAEIAVLAGNADENEDECEDACPTLEVVYDEKQDSHEPVSDHFLEWFDEWVDEARSQGKKIAIRCNCGCHRTGRLAAYYQMKYQNVPMEEAIETMYRLGRYWALHRDLAPQVRALKDYIDGKPCSQAEQYCVDGAP
jgi:protein-tyrosine phosphatase